jgi:hypothetical protein
MLNLAQEIKEGTAITDNELKRHLQSLACGKFKVLKKHPPGREINDDDSFSFNNDFTCPMQKIKIATVSSKIETTEERKETRDRIDEERKHQIDVSTFDCCNTLSSVLISFCSSPLGLSRAYHEGQEAYDAHRSCQ